MLVPVPAAAVSYMMCKILLIAQDFAPSYNNTNTQLGDRDLYTGDHAIDDATATEVPNARADSSSRRRLQLLDLLVQLPDVVAHDRRGTATIALKLFALQHFCEVALRLFAVPPPVPEALRNLRIGRQRVVALYLRLEARLDLLEPGEAPDIVGLEVALVVEGLFFQRVLVFNLN